MGLEPRGGMPLKIVPQDLQERVRDFYSPQIEALGLSKDQMRIPMKSGYYPKNLYQ